MTNSWDKRFDTPEYVYGTIPNLFFKQQIDGLQPGKILLPCEGEGRHAVYAAKLGWEVTAFDYSTVAREKAMALAEKNNVSIIYNIHDIAEMDYRENSFDFIALFYAHSPADVRPVFHKQLVKYLKPKGILILEGFSKNHEQFQDKTQPFNGPKNLDHLFSKSDILDDFSALTCLEIQETDTQRQQSAQHFGWRSIIRYIGENIF